MTTTIKTLENGNVEVTRTYSDWCGSSSVTSEYTVRSGRVHVAWANGTTSEACEGLRPTGYFIDVADDADLESVIRAQLA